MNFWQWKVSDFNTHSPKFMTLGVEWNPVGAPPGAAATARAITCRCNSHTWDSILALSHPYLYNAPAPHIHTHTCGWNEKFSIFDRTESERPLSTQSKTGAFKITDLWLLTRERKTLAFVLLNFQKRTSHAARRRGRERRLISHLRRENSELSSFVHATAASVELAPNFSRRITLDNTRTLISMQFERQWVRHVEKYILI